jgi:hypothetical protein
MVVPLNEVCLNGEIHFKENEPWLRIEFFNRSSEALIFSDDFLDPRSSSNYFSAVSNSPLREMLQLGLPMGIFNDSDVMIAPGQKYKHEFPVGRYFLDLEEYLRMGDVTVFWSLRLEPTNRAEILVVNGHVIVPGRWLKQREL